MNREGELVLSGLHASGQEQESEAVESCHLVILYRYRIW